MTTEPMRPARIAGLALLGVAAVATVLGVVTLLGGNGEPSAGQTSITLPAGATTTPPGASSDIAGPPPGTGTAPTTTPAAGTSTTSEPTAMPTAPGTGPAPGGPGGSDGGPSYQDIPVRVYNNSTITGLADRAAAEIKAAGWNVVDVDNHQGLVPETTVYFRPGTPEEAAAKELARAFGIRALPRFEGIQDASPGLIVIITKEWAERGGQKR
ncbi:LytR C-terminal domain-containing protein [Actinokineospora sp. NPDC004072]